MDAPFCGALPVGLVYGALWLALSGKVERASSAQTLVIGLISIAAAAVVFPFSYYWGLLISAGWYTGPIIGVLSAFAVRFVATHIPHSDQSLLPCRRCGYSLIGNTSGRCPECGSLIPADGIAGDPPCTSETHKAGCDRPVDRERRLSQTENRQLEKETIDALRASLIACADLLEAQREAHWAEQLRKVVPHCHDENLTVYDLDKILSWFGGMGSLNEALPEDESVGRQIDALLSMIYETARSLSRKFSRRLDRR